LSGKSAIGIWTVSLIIFAERGCGGTAAQDSDSRRRLIGGCLARLDR